MRTRRSRPGLRFRRQSLSFAFGMMRPSSTLTRQEAQRKLSAFIEELDSGWERDGLEWGPELLVRLREFDQAA
jgi:hypothetical protein